MIGHQHHIPYDGGVWDSFAEMDALEKARNARLKKAREVNASAEAFAQVTAGLDVVLDRLAANNPEPKTTTTVAATIDQLSVENRTLKAINFELQTRCLALQTELHKLRAGIK